MNWSGEDVDLQTASDQTQRQGLSLGGNPKPLRPGSQQARRGNRITKSENGRNPILVSAVFYAKTGDNLAFTL